MVGKGSSKPAREPPQANVAVAHIPWRLITLSISGASVTVTFVLAGRQLPTRQILRPVWQALGSFPSAGIVAISLGLMVSSLVAFFRWTSIRRSCIYAEAEAEKLVIEARTQAQVSVIKANAEAETRIESGRRQTLTRVEQGLPPGGELRWEQHGPHRIIEATTDASDPRRSSRFTRTDTMDDGPSS